jgi:hypothetical protein
MSDKKVVKPVALAVGAALAGSFALSSGIANADSVESPFAMSTMSAGYMLGAEGSWATRELKLPVVATRKAVLLVRRKAKLPVVVTRKAKPLVAATKTLKLPVVATRTQKLLVAAIKKLKAPAAKALAVATSLS